MHWLMGAISTIAKGVEGGCNRITSQRIGRVPTAPKSRSRRSDRLARIRNAIAREACFPPYLTRVTRFSHV